MKNSAAGVNSQGIQDGSDIVSASDVRRTLSAILESAPFRSSIQIQKLLQHIVTETLAGRTETLKERVIGTSIFDKRSDYDTNQDPIVRLRVAEVRKRLAVYYQMTQDESVLISIPSGSFRAVFERTHKQPVQLLSALPLSREQTQPQAVPITPRGPQEVAEPYLKPSHGRFRDRRWWIVFAASVVILSLVMPRYFVSPEDARI